MPRSPSRRLVRFALATIALVSSVLALSPATVSAHNTLLSSDPATGAVLAVAPTQITWQFENPVPLETMTVTLIDAAGVRSEVGGSTHGAAGDTQVVTPLPVLASGEVSLRWRLVGSDGHPITGRVDITVSAAPVATQPQTTAAVPAATVPVATELAEPGPIAAGPDETSVAQPETAGSATATTPPDTAAGASAQAGEVTAVESAAESAVDSAVEAGDDSAFSTPSALRWFLRYGSYLSIMAVVGIMLTGAWVWPAADRHRLLRSILSRSLLVTAVLGFVQLLVVASDIAGEPLWASFGSIGAATTTTAGMALLVRAVLAPSMWIMLFRDRLVHPDVQRTAAAMSSLALLATWAFAGHSSSMRWPTLGVMTDVAHHAAAAVWIAGLAIVGWILIPRTQPEVMVPAVRNFSRVAAISVGVLVVTGLIQSWRLVGNPADLWAADHGRYLAVKVVLLGAVLVVANLNRRRVDQRLGDPSTIEQNVGSLRQAVAAEFAIGLVIVAITAAMVVSPPATSETDRDTETQTQTETQTETQPGAPQAP